MTGGERHRDENTGGDADLLTELRNNGLALEDSLSYGRRKGFIRHVGADFVVSATGYFWMIDFNGQLSRERRQLLVSKSFAEQGNGLWMRDQAGMSSAEIEALAGALDAKRDQQP
jgi:hypothetical protein